VTALSTALRLRRQSETVIALGVAAVDMSILSLRYLRPRRNIFNQLCRPNASTVPSYERLAAVA
jgi:hypothetical protein